MTAYIDMQSLGPTEPLAALRIELLGLSGTLIPPEHRLSALHALSQGDSVICMPSAYPYWRRLASDIPIVNAQDTRVQDDPKKRVDSWIEWRLTLMGVKDAAVLIKNPPKTEKHQYYAKWIEAETGVYTEALTYETRKPLPPDLPTVGTKVEEEQPYEWRLYGAKISDHDLVSALMYPIGQEERKNTVIGVDVETDLAGSEPNETRDTLVGVGLAFGNECFYGTTFNEDWMHLLRTYLSIIPWVGWNAKYDATVLRRHGITPGPLYGDGMLAAYLAGEHRAALKPYVLRTYGVRMIEYDDVTGGGKTKISEIDPEKTAEYCCGDAYWALRSEADLRPKLSTKALSLYTETDLPMVDTIVDMELAGIKLDREGVTETKVNTVYEIVDLELAIDDLARATGFALPDTRIVCKGCRNGKKKKLTCIDCYGGGEFFLPNAINPGSSKQLVQWLHTYLKIPVRALSQKTQQPSVDSLALLRMQHEHPAIPLILRWRTLERYRQFLEDWLNEADEDDRIHTSFTLAHTHSGRLSSRDPNLQQLALPWRKHFVAANGMTLVAADYRSLEVGVAAFVSRDERLMSIVNGDPTTLAGDIHSQNVERLFKVPYADQHKAKHLRVRAKNFLFGALYGSKGYEVQEVLERELLKDPSLGDPPTLAETIKGIQDISYIYPHYFNEWVPFMIEKTREEGMTAYTAFGRPRVLPDLRSSVQSLRQAAERATINHIVQGTAADIARMACNRVTRLEGGTLLLQIHDELLSEVDGSSVDTYISRMVECMELGQPLDGVPLVVDVGVGPDWMSCHK